MTPAQEGANSGPRNALQRLAKQKASLLFFPQPPPRSPWLPQKISQGTTDLPAQRCSARGGGAGKGDAPNSGFGVRENPLTHLNTPTHGADGQCLGALRRAGTVMKRPFLWVGSSRALQHPTPPPQAAGTSPGWEKEKRVYLQASGLLSTRGLDLPEPRSQVGVYRAEGPSRVAKTEEATSARDAHLSRRPLGPAGSWVGARCPRLTARDLFPRRRRRRRRRERCPRRIRISELPPLPGMRALCPSREEVRRPVPGRVASARDAGGGGAVFRLSHRRPRRVPATARASREGWTPPASRSLSNRFRPRPGGQEGPRLGDLAPGFGDPPRSRYSAPRSPKSPAPRRAQRVIRRSRTRRQSLPGPPRSWGVTPHP